jgi:excisionase family DNA binding protein
MVHQVGSPGTTLPEEQNLLAGAKLLYSVREAAEMLSIGRVKLYELINAGRIASVKLDGSRRIPREALEEFVNGLRTDAL